MEINGVPLKIGSKVALLQERHLSTGTLPAGQRCKVLEMYHPKGEPKTWLKAAISPGVGEAVPSSMAGISVGTVISIGLGSENEQVTVTAVGPVSFTAEFTKPHDAKTKILPLNGLTLEVKVGDLKHIFPAHAGEVEIKGDLK